MMIKVDNQETLKLLQQLCDIALRAGGVQNLVGVTQVLNSISIMEPPETQKPILEPVTPKEEK